jgi:hypothetical protein
MAEPAVHSTRIDEIRQAQLPDAVQTLHVRVLQHVKYQFIRYRQKTEYGIVYYLPFISHTPMRAIRHFKIGYKDTAFF